MATSRSARTIATLRKKQDRRCPVSLLRMPSNEQLSSESSRRRQMSETNGHYHAGVEGDPREAFALAIAQAQRVIDAVKPEQLGSPTPCTEYNVAQLQNHL